MVSFDELVSGKTNNNPYWKTTNVAGGVLPGFDIPAFDSILCSTTGSSTIVTYKKSGNTVATLTVTDNGAGLVEVTKS